MFGLDVDVIREIRAVFDQSPRIQKVLIYGSRAKGNYKAGSDIDLTLIGKGLSSENTVYPLMGKLDDLNFPYTFDISIFKKLNNLDFIDHILRVGKIFYQKDDKKIKEWNDAPLKDVCDYFGDGDWIESKDQSPNGIRLIQTGNVGEGLFKNRKDKARFISSKTFNRLHCKEIFEGDCLVSRLPEPVGRSCIVPKTSTRMITAVDCTIIRFNQKSILPGFFKYYSQSQEYLHIIDKKTTGATRKCISRKNLGDISIKYPSIKEQQKIIATLDKAFEAIDKAIQNTEKNIKNYQDIFDLYLKNIFVSSHAGWDEQLLENVCTLRSGKTLSKEAEEENGDIPCLKVADMNNIENLEGVTSKGDIINEFLFIYFLQLDIGKISNATSIPQINHYSIRPLKIRFPVLKLDQEAIVAEFNFFNKKTKELKYIYQQKIIKLQELKESVLQEAFNGEL